MTKLKLALQKVTLVALLIASLPTVIPFFLLVIDMIVNKEDAIFAGIMDFMVATVDEINEDNED